MFFARNIAAAQILPKLAIKKFVFAALLILCVARWLEVMNGHFQTHWALDFQYFWMAGKSWIEGKSAYLPEYLAEGSLYSPVFSSPFFYPPAILPLLAPLGLIPMDTAAPWVFALNLGLLVFTARMIAKIATNQHPTIDPITVYISFIVIFSIFMRPTVEVIAYGQITMVLTLALALFIYAVQNSNNKLAACSLTILLLKPHIGLGILIYSLCKKNLRHTAYYAILLTGILSIIGLSADQPIASILGYIQNVTAYSAQPENTIRETGGLGLLLSFIGITLNAPTTVILIVIIAAIIARSAFEDVVQSTMIIITATLTVSPHHSTDFVLLIPAFLLLLNPGKRNIRLGIAITLFVICRSWNIAAFLLQAPEPSVKWFVAIEHTIAFSALLVLMFIINMNKNSINTMPINR